MFFYRNQFNTTPTFSSQQQNQWNPSSVENDFDLGNGGAGPSASGQTPKNNHQKASERMSEDESELLIFKQILTKK